MNAEIYECECGRGCGHEHGHGCGHEPERGQQKELLQIGAGALLFAAGLISKGRLGPWVALGLFLAAFLALGAEVIWGAVKGMLHGEIFDENFLMSIAAAGAFAIGEYPEGAAVMLFYRVGELFEARAVAKSRRSVANLMDIRPDAANLLRGGELTVVSPETVLPGDLILIKPGERVPLDGVVLEGRSMLDTAALTGESVPRAASPGDELPSGCVNLSGVLSVRVTKPYGESTVSRILALVESAAAKKSAQEKFITKFSRWYTPAVVAAAVLLAGLPPLLIPGARLSDWLYRALTFLVVSCPCALVISVPLSFFGGIGGASRRGILIKGGNYLEALAKTEIAVFDKTGTLTKGVFEVRDVVPAAGFTGEQLLTYAAGAEAYSSHPIAASLRRAAGDPPGAVVTEVRELSGRGVSALVGGKTVLAGSGRLLRENGIGAPETAGGTVVHVAVDGLYAGHIGIADALRPDAAEAVAALKRAGVRETVMLTGDAEGPAGEAAARLGIDRYYARLLPDGKVAKVEELLQSLSPNGKLVFVGDGVNDAPVLARADVGVAMGGLGSDAAIEAADVVVMTDEPSKLAAAIRIARRTLRIARQNIALALGIKFMVLILGAFGAATMWEAVFADVGVAILAVLNAMRSLNTKDRGFAPPAAKPAGSGASDS